MVGTLLWTRTMSPTMINEARFNVTRWYFDEIASNPDMPGAFRERPSTSRPATNLLSSTGRASAPACSTRPPTTSATR